MESKSVARILNLTFIASSVDLENHKWLHRCLNVQSEQKMWPLTAS